VENEHFVLGIVGREGSGKSGTALSLAAALDEDFHAERVCFEPADILRLIQSDETGRGSAMILDEAGVGMGARSWYDKAQIKLNKTLQTIRDDNQILILTLPALGELDSMTVNRLHAYAEMTSLDPGERARFKFKFLHPQRGPSGETYEEYPRRRYNGRRVKVTRMAVEPPPSDVWEAYEKRKAAFKEELYQETIEDLEAADEDDSPDPQTVVEKIQSNGGAEAYTREINNGTQTILDADLIAAEYDVTHATAKRAKSLLLSQIDQKVM
jgi:ABC-type dipeptide/oligopeptide/nickel transport system ATPase component